MFQLLVSFLLTGYALLYDWSLHVVAGNKLTLLPRLVDVTRGQHLSTPRLNPSLCSPKITQLSIHLCYIVVKMSTSITGDKLNVQVVGLE